MGFVRPRLGAWYRNTRAGGPPRARALPWDLGPVGAVALFFAPSVVGGAYCLVRGRGNFQDGFSKVLTEVSQGYFQPNTGGENVPVCEGELSDLAGDEPLFKALYGWFLDLGGVYKLAFGPKAFLVVSDPVVVKHVLSENYSNYDKGVLADILEPIMGKGLIPADLETWKPRRRAIVPAFHQAYIEEMVRMFARCTEEGIKEFDGRLAAAGGGPGTAFETDMETNFLSIGLDIIGLGVFNYKFGSITEESPVIKAVYGVLKEAEHRSTFYIPYWDLPLANVLVPRQRAFYADLKVINDCLDELIAKAKTISSEDDIEALQARDYSKIQDPSLLRFLVDMRGENMTNKQLRDDLMTMLIAGHETTAAVLTWALFNLMDRPEQMRAAQAEVDAVLGDRAPTIPDLKRLRYVRAVIAESLRAYPQPPILIRKALEDDVLPGGLTGDPAGYPIGKGTDLFISVWNLHRHPDLWDRPDEFDPTRWERDVASPYPDKWKGYRSELVEGKMYPNETAADFAFIPFGGGARKCVGDQFALMEATVVLAMLLRRYDFSLAVPKEKVGMATGATIHTANGMPCTVKARTPEAAAPEAAAESVAA